MHINSSTKGSSSAVFRIVHPTNGVARKFTTSAIINCLHNNLTDLQTASNGKTRMRHTRLSLYSRTFAHLSRMSIEVRRSEKTAFANTLVCTNTNTHTHARRHTTNATIEITHVFVSARQSSSDSLLMVMSRCRTIVAATARNYLCSPYSHALTQPAQWIKYYMRV